MAKKSMNYSVEHLKIAYYAGLEQLRFDQALERISRSGTSSAEFAPTVLPGQEALSYRSETLPRKNKGKKLYL